MNMETRRLPPEIPQSLRQTWETRLAKTFWRDVRPDMDAGGDMSLSVFWLHFNQACSMTVDEDDAVMRGLLASQIVRQADNDTLRRLSPDIHLQLVQEIVALPDSMNIREQALRRLFCTVRPTREHRDIVFQASQRAVRTMMQQMDVQAIGRHWTKLSDRERKKMVGIVARSYFSAFGWSKKPDIRLISQGPDKNHVMMFGGLGEQGEILINTHPEAGWNSFASTLHTTLHESHRAVVQSMARGYITSQCETTVSLLAINQIFFAMSGHDRKKSVSCLAYRKPVSLCYVDGQDAFYEGYVFERDAYDAADQMMRLVLHKRPRPGISCRPR